MHAHLLYDILPTLHSQACRNVWGGGAAITQKYEVHQNVD